MIALVVLLDIILIISYPSNPGATRWPKSYVPGWLQRLKVFVRLEEGANEKSIADAKSDQEIQNISPRPDWLYVLLLARWHFYVVIP